MTDSIKLKLQPILILAFGISIVLLSTLSLVFGQDNNINLETPSAEHTEEPTENPEQSTDLMQPSLCPESLETSIVIMPSNTPAPIIATNIPYPTAISTLIEITEESSSATAIAELTEAIQIIESTQSSSEESHETLIATIQVSEESTAEHFEERIVPSTEATIQVPTVLPTEAISVALLPLIETTVEASLEQTEVVSQNTPESTVTYELTAEATLSISEPLNYQIMGEVEGLSENTLLTVHLMSETAVQTDIFENAQFQYQLPNGHYQLIIIVPLYLPLNLEFDVLGTNYDLPIIQLIAGDYDGDGVISSSDINLLRYYYGQSASNAPSQMDLNHDGIIDLFDLTTLASQIDLSAEK